MKLRNENASLKDDNKSKLKIIELLKRSCAIVNNENQNTQTRNDWKQVKQNHPFPRNNTENCNIISTLVPNLMPAQNHSRRPNICITESYLRNYYPPAVPGNSSYAIVSKFGKNIFAVGDSHVKRIKRLDFNKEFRSGKAFFRSSSGANSKQLDQYIIPTIVDDKPDVVLLHVGTNDILSNANNTELANNMINIILA